MSTLIRRRSMEQLQLYDLDQVLNKESSHDFHRRPSVQVNTGERYQFLCNSTRTRLDPIYAATPMFTTIPSSSMNRRRLDEKKEEIDGKDDHEGLHNPKDFLKRLFHRDEHETFP